MTTQDWGEGRTSSGGAVDAGVARDLSRLARRMQAEDDSDALLQLIVDAAVAEVEGAGHAGISLVTKGRVQTPAQTSELVGRVDELQYQADEGPCLSSLREELTVRSADLADESRWPRFARGAVELGIRSMLSVQLFVDGDNLGALNMYAEQADAFTDDGEEIGLLLAAHAAVAIVDARKIDNLQLALDSRDLIGQAKGIVMERYKVSAAQAFGTLVAVSQRSHRKLRDVAEQLALTGELPDVPA